jgi:hypothetical protein
MYALAQPPNPICRTFHDDLHDSGEGAHFGHHGHGAFAHEALREYVEPLESGRRRGRSRASGAPKLWKSGEVASCGQNGDVIFRN